MRLLLFLTLFTFQLNVGKAQDTANTRLVALPITDYIVPADSFQIVQIMLPEGLSISNKQLGVLCGIYHDGKADTAQIGWGRCNLIEEHYYYFGLHLYDQQRVPSAGELMYTRINKTNAYFGKLSAVAVHAVTLQTVYGDNLYDPLQMLLKWTSVNETAMLDTLVADIRFTGKTMKDQMPDSNHKLNGQKYKDKLLFDAMQLTTKNDLKDFLDYMAARPRNYAGNSWKISEIYATWLDAGAPMLVK